MANLKDLLVNGASRFVGKVYSTGGFVGNLEGKATSAFEADSAYPKSHAHGNLHNDGTISVSNSSSIPADSRFVVTDPLDSHKIISSGLYFNGTDATKALTPKGTWEPFAAPEHSHGF